MLSSPGAGRTGCFQMSPCRSLVVNRAAPGRVSWPAECTNPHGCGMSVDEEVVGPAGLEADLSPLLLDLLGQAPGDQHGKLPARSQHSANAAERLRNYRLRRGIVLIELAPRRVCQHHINSVIGDRGKPTRILGQLSYARSACQPGQQLSGPVRIAKIRADCFLERLPYPRRDERAAASERVENDVGRTGTHRVHDQLGDVRGKATLGRLSTPRTCDPLAEENLAQVPAGYRPVLIPTATRREPASACPAHGRLQTRPDAARHASQLTVQREHQPV